MAIKSSDVKLELKEARQVIEEANIDSELKNCFMSMFKVISIHARMNLDVRSNTTSMMKEMGIKLNTVQEFDGPVEIGNKSDKFDYVR